jgi:TPR repeat protein
VTQDAVEAVKWYRVAAERGYPESQYGLAEMYDSGEGVLQDQVEAAEWYLKAAKQGHVDAVERIGDMYENGIGVPPDLIEAYAWYAVGCEIGHKGFLLKLEPTAAALGNERNGMLAEAKKRAADYLNRYDLRRRLRTSLPRCQPADAAPSSLATRFLSPARCESCAIERVRQWDQPTVRSSKPST